MVTNTSLKREGSKDPMIYTLVEHSQMIRKVKGVALKVHVLVGEDADVLAQNVKLMAEENWKKFNIPDRWDGRSAERIVSILLE